MSGNAASVAVAPSRPIDTIGSEELLRYLRAVSVGNRTSGSPDEAAVFDYLEHTLRGFGYRIVRETPPCLIGYPIRSAVEARSPESFALESNGYAMAPSTPPGGVEGELVHVGEGQEADYPPFSVRGCIALTSGRPGGTASLAADRAGVAAQIFVNGDHIPDGIISPVWGAPTMETAPFLPQTPAVGIRGTDGARLLELMARGPVVVRVTTETYRDWRPIPILTGELPGTEEDRFALLSAHADSWGEGAMDNGSGNAVLLAVARMLAERRHQLRRGVRVAFWSGHSHGRYAGSAWYADRYWLDLRERCVCHVSADAVGAHGATSLAAAPTLAETYAFGARIVREVAGAALRYRRMPSRMSEQSFLHVGIPSCFATLSEQSEGPFDFGWWIHTPHDTLDKVDPGHLLRDARIYAATMWDLCTLPILPFDFAAAAKEIGGHLGRLQRAHGSRFDLTVLVAAAERLAGDLDQLDGAWAERAGANTANTILMELAHALIPVNYSAHGPFDQDLTVSPHPPLPGLAALARLERATPGSPEAHMLEVGLVRHRNRIAAALAVAQRIASRARPPLAP